MLEFDHIEIASTIRRTGFADSCVEFSQDVKFQDWEVDYKRRLAYFFGVAMDAVLTKDRNWSRDLRAAFTRSENNLVNWRVWDPFLKWCEQKPVRARRILSRLWATSPPTRSRFIRFTAELEREGFKQPGTQLCLGSVLLMATDPDAPPIRMQVVKKAFAQIGLSTAGALTAIDAYDLFLRLLDELIIFSIGSASPLGSRLKAQGAVWCATGGWKGHASVVRPDTCVADLDSAAEGELQEADGVLQELQSTEREALIRARVGQGAYRTGLMKVWHGTCAVTGCAREELLIASHLKPWRVSTNTERLDAFNGLLLLPHFDAALDRCLISFTKEGRMMVSRTLRHEETRALGLDGGRRLRFVHPKHAKYLAYHRSLFHQRERVFGFR